MIKTENNHKHYIAIKSLRRLLSSSNNKHNGKQYYFMNCLQGYSDKSSRDEPIGYCKNNESVRIEIPYRKPIVQYSKGQFQFKVPFIMYADFESILELIQGLSNNPRASSTRGVNIHTPSGWCILSRFAYGKLNDPIRSYRGKDCINKFCENVVA